jgi:hypothetical protein
MNSMRKRKMNNKRQTLEEELKQETEGRGRQTTNDRR